MLRLKPTSAAISARFPVSETAENHGHSIFQISTCHCLLPAAATNTEDRGAPTTILPADLPPKKPEDLPNYFRPR